MRLARVVAVLLFAGLRAQSAPFDHSAWDAILKQYVSEIGEVDYAALKSDRKQLDAYVERLTAASPDSDKPRFPTRNHELAYWLNAYNALVMKGVVDAYPTRSVRDLGALYGFFRRKDYKLGGQPVSLQALENDIIRKRYREPRIHFAIVCASISCPRLGRDALTGEKLEPQLDGAARRFFGEPRNLTIGENGIILSALMQWYKSDFGDVLEFVKKYAGEKDRRAIEVMKNPKLRYYEYDWSINDPGSRAKAKSDLERELARSAP